MGSVCLQALTSLFASLPLHASAIAFYSHSDSFLLTLFGNHRTSVSHMLNSIWMKVLLATIVYNSPAIRQIICLMNRYCYLCTLYQFSYLLTCISSLCCNNTSLASLSLPSLLYFYYCSLLFKSIFIIFESVAPPNFRVRHDLICRHTAFFPLFWSCRPLFYISSYIYYY